MLDQFPQYSPFQEQPENRMSYPSPYGIENQMPMNPSSMNLLPDQYSQGPFNSIQPRYAEGGEVHPQDMMMLPQQEQMPQQMPQEQSSQQGLSELAQLIQQQGQGEDSVLAHINREEAALLAKKYGYDVNPMTGLPQFGFFKKIKKFGKKVFKGAKKIGRYALPIAGTVGGALIGGPVGATIGGGLGGAGGAALNKKNILKGGLLGAATGYGVSKLLPGIAPNFAASIGLPGAASTSGVAGSMGNRGEATDLKGYIANAKSNTLRDAFQKTIGNGGSAGGLGAVLAPLLGPGGEGGNVAQRLLPTALTALTGGSDQGNGQGGNSLLGPLLGDKNGNLIDNGLALTALIGTFMGREKKPKQTSLTKLAQQLPPQWQSYHQPRPIGAYGRQYVPLPAGYSPTTHGEHQFFRDVNPWQYHRGGTVDLARGGYIEGDDDGHADTREVPLSDGDFIFDATTVANLGNGNNKAGALKLAHMEQALHRRGGNSHSSQPPRSILAKLSDGEYRMPSPAVTNLGNGKNKVGSKILKNMVKNVRNHKGVKGFPPKAKSLQQYMQMKQR